MRKSTLIILFSIFTVCVFSVMNMFLLVQGKKDDAAVLSRAPQQPEAQPQEHDKAKKISGKLTRRMFLDPSRKFYENTVFAGGEKIARFKSDGERIYDVEGRIPDGKFQFKNITQKTYGTERFENGERNGNYQEYFPNGRLKFEKEYFYGDIVSLKEYYVTGQLRMSIDYTNALWLTGEDEVGDGKIFFKDGIVMYEWHLTSSDPNRYKKAYNYKGELVETLYFDAEGNFLNKVRPLKNHQEG